MFFSLYHCRVWLFSSLAYEQTCSRDARPTVLTNIDLCSAFITRLHYWCMSRDLEVSWFYVTLIDSFYIFIIIIINIVIIIIWLHEISRIRIIIIASLSEDEWGYLECLYKACQAITDGGLFTDTGVQQRCENDNRVKMIVRWKPLARSRGKRTGKSLCKQD